MTEPPQVPTKFQLENPDVPYWDFPPFPPLESRHITPFKDFKPAGLCVEFNEDEEEVDGLGIPTLTLRVFHDVDKAKKRKRKGARIGTGERLPWHEEWAELVQKPQPFDPLHDRHDRVDQADREFQIGREFPPLILTLYNEWRLFIGLTDNTGFDKKFKRAPTTQLPPEGNDASGGAPEVEDDPISDDEADEGPVVNSNNATDAMDFSKSSPYDLDVDLKEDRMSLFLDDPEKAVEVFFSTHFLLRGLFFGNASIRWTPFIVRSFLEFLLRHHVVPEIENRLKRAVETAHLAEDQLQRTKQVSLNFPDEWGSTCYDLFGTMEPIVWGIEGLDIPEQPDGGEIHVTEIDPDLPLPKLTAVDETLDSHPAPKTVTTAIPTDTVVSAIDSKFARLNIEGDVSETAVEDSSTLPNPWKDLSENSGTIEDWANGGALRWDEESNEEPTWGAPLPRPNIFQFLGPSSFPYTHVPIRAERSDREIVAIYPPVSTSKSPQGSVSPFHANFSSVVLKPWDPKKADPDIPPPVMVRDHAVSYGYSMPHDPRKDNITVLVSPSATEGMVPGLGFGGIFVQVIQRSETIQDKKSSKFDGRAWWYVEANTQVFPSFWRRHALR